MREVSQKVTSAAERLSLASWCSPLLSRGTDRGGTLTCRFTKMSDTKAAQVSKKKIQWGFELPSLSLKNFSQEMPFISCCQCGIPDAYIALSLHLPRRRPFCWHYPTVFFKDHARKRTFHPLCKMSGLEAGQRKHLTVHRNSPQQPGENRHEAKAVTQNGWVWAV